MTQSQSDIDLHGPEPQPPRPLNRFKVTLAHGAKRTKRIVVEAEYMKVDNGTLWFRTYNASGYPHVVRCFASGAWQDVEVLA